MAKRNQSFADYTKIRDIVVKRNKRAVAAGLAMPIHFPTVKEIRKGIVDPAEAIRAVKEYYAAGSQVKAIRQTGLVPEFKSFPTMPDQPKLTIPEQKERKRQQQRDYRRRRKVRDTALSPEQANKYEGYLKALNTVLNGWKRSGVNLGMNLRSLTPSQAQAFVEYMDYRFSQGDFTQRYVIDEFIQDFSRLLQKGHNAKSITKDFEKFLEDRNQLSNRYQSMEGLTRDEFQASWYEFMGD